MALYHPNPIVLDDIPIINMPLYSTADKVPLVHVKVGQFYIRANINKALKSETRQNRIIIAALILRVTIVSSRPDTPMKHWNLNTNNKAYSKYIFDIICFLPLPNLA